MRIAKTISLVLSGALAGSAFVLSCGDNWHLATDAAIDAPQAPDAPPACDCPAAEPPLAGRFMVFSNLRFLAGNDSSAQGAGCPAGMNMLQLSGSCTTDLSDPLRNVTIGAHLGFFDNPPTAWSCSFRNNDPTQVTMRVSVICLKPAP